MKDNFRISYVALIDFFPDFFKIMRRMYIKHLPVKHVAQIYEQMIWLEDHDKVNAEESLIILDELLKIIHIRVFIVIHLIC